MPALLKPLARIGIDKHQAIADAILGRRPQKPNRKPTAQAGLHSVVISLTESATAIDVTFSINDVIKASQSIPALPRDLAHARDRFLRGFRTGARTPASAQRLKLETNLAELGRTLRDLCLPADASAQLAALRDASPAGTIVEICFEAKYRRTPRLAL